ncbi:MAG: hypothetical protein ACFFD4_15795 [Candidatus Odinarchaeota archaeon]
MKNNSWYCKDLSLTINFRAFQESALVKQIPIFSWHQAPAIPEKKIRSGMLQFIVATPLPDELAFLPAVLHCYGDIVSQFISHLSSPAVSVQVLLGRAAPHGFYSRNPLGFTEKEIKVIKRVTEQSPESPPDLEKLGIAGTTIDVRKLKSLPPVFERVNQVPDRNEQYIILGLHDHPPERLLPAMLGRFFHGLGHALVIGRLVGDEYEELAQSWGKTVLRIIRDHLWEHPLLLSQLPTRNESLFPESGSLSLEQLCQAAIPAAFTGELFEQKEFFSLLEQLKEKLS